MLSDYLEPFCRMPRTQVPDGLGGTLETWDDGPVFSAAVTDQRGQIWENGGLAALYTQPVMLHEPGVSLHLHERVRRVRDGVIFRVLGESDDQRTPAVASLSYACVPVEKVVTAP